MMPIIGAGIIGIMTFYLKFIFIGIQPGKTSVIQVIHYPPMKGDRAKKNRKGSGLENLPALFGVRTEYYLLPAASPFSTM